MSKPHLVIVNDASVARGGATGLALLQARLARERGLAVTFVAGDRAAPMPIAADGVEVIHVGGDALLKAHPLTALTKGFYNRASADLLARLVAERDTPDTVYHVHSFAKSLSPSIFTALRPVASRVFAHAHDYFLACPNGGFMDYQAMEPCERVPLSTDCLTTQCDKRNYAQKLWRVSRQALLHRVMPRDRRWGGIVLIHPGMRPYLEKSGYPSDLIHTVRNPAAAFRAERVEAERNGTLFFVGRLEAEKGIRELLEVASAGNLPLRVVGEGPLREELAARYPTIPFLGWRNREEIAEIVGEARALVMPTRYPEPFGLVAAEASLSGLPVILSRTALLGPEIAAHGLGLTCDPQDAAAFGRTLREMLDMPAARVEAMSQHGASGEAGLCTTADAWIDAQIELWEGAIARARPLPLAV